MHFDDLLSERENERVLLYFLVYKFQKLIVALTVNKKEVSFPFILMSSSRAPR